MMFQKAGDRQPSFRVLLDCLIDGTSSEETVSNLIRRVETIGVNNPSNNHCRPPCHIGLKDDN